jgi:type II secretory pathway component PulJ
MKRNHKLPAFTIMEVTIAMLVSAILIAIVYTAFAIVSRSYSGFVFKNEEAAGLVQLDLLLKRDFRRADLITRTDSGIVLKNDKDVTRYMFETNDIVRINGITDTFKVKTDHTAMLFEQQAVDITSDKPALVDELNLDLVFQNEKIRLRYYKPYSAVNLFEQDTHANN